MRLLKQHPVGVIPVTRRLEANFVRALNHHRGAFKAKNKRMGAPHFLVSECLDAALAQIVKAGGKEGKAGNWTEHQ